MASRRSTRSQTASSEPVEVTPRRGVLKAHLPPIPSAINTNYGSPHAALPVALRRRHDLRSAVGSALAAANQSPEVDEESEAPGSDEEDDGGFLVDDEDGDVLRRLTSPLPRRFAKLTRDDSVTAILSRSHTHAGAGTPKTPWHVFGCRIGTQLCARKRHLWGRHGSVERRPCVFRRKERGGFRTALAATKYGSTLATHARASGRTAACSKEIGAAEDTASR